jgi:hypothetical protein
LFGTKIPHKIIKFTKKKAEADLDNHSVPQEKMIVKAGCSTICIR